MSQVNRKAMGLRSVRKGGLVNLGVDDLLNDRDLLEKVLEEWRTLQALVRESPLHFCVYDADDNLIAWNARYETSYPCLLYTSPSPRDA